MSEALRDKAAITNAAEAAEWIAQAQFDHGEGIGPDLEAKSLTLARQFGLKEPPIRFRWAKARAKRAEEASVAAPAQPEPEAEPEKVLGGTPEPRVMLPAVIPPTPPPVTWDDAIEAMNDRHAIIDNVGGKTVIAGWEPSQLDPARMVVVFQNKESFLLRYSNRYAIIDVSDGRGGTRQTSMALGQWWLSHRQRRQYRGVTFLPAGPKVVNECLNLWRGWGVEPKPGDWSLIREHIEVVLAGGNKEFSDYITRWIAWAIQNPAAQAEVALVLIGVKGVGKGTLVRCLQRIFGVHAFQVTSREHVIDKFNGHLQDCILFIADEAYWGGDKRCVGRLQGMITEPTLPIERKGLDVFEVKNFLHVIMLAEPGWVIPAGRYERRYAAIAVSGAKRGDKAYFKALHRQIYNGGAEAMFYDLAAMDLGDWHPREIPEALLTNPALQKQQSHTLPPLEQWYVMLLHDGRIPGAFKKGKSDVRSTAYTMSLIEDARKKVPRLHDLTEVALRNFLVNEDQIGAICTKHRGASGNGWTFPPLAEAREAWSRQYGPQQWDAPDMIDWGKAPPKAKEAPKADEANADAPPTSPPKLTVVAGRASWRRY
jgi:Family of unknown function (DUF5906)